MDGKLAGTTQANVEGQWSFIPSTALSEGLHQAWGVARNKAGDESPPSEVHGFTVDLMRPEAPTVSVPRLVNTQHPIIAGSAEPGSTVTLSLDGSVVGTAIANPEGLWGLIVATALVEGPHDTEAMATDPAGNVGTPSEAITFIVDFRPPEAPGINPLDAFIDTRRPIIGGTAETGTAVTVWLDGKMAVPIGVTPVGTWNFTPTEELEAGTHQVKATAQDAAGNISVPSAERSFVVRRSHYGWSCASAPAVPAIWTLCALTVLIGRRRVRSHD